MSSYCTLQQDTQLIVLFKSAAVPTSHDSQQINTGTTNNVHSIFINEFFYSLTRLSCFTSCIENFKGGLVPKYHAMWREVFTIAMRKYFVFPPKT